MTCLHFIYNMVTACLALLALPLAWCHERRDPQRKQALLQRLGRGEDFTATADRQQPVIWIHAVSVGEVKATETIVAALETFGFRGSIVVTTTTMTGQHYARKQFDGRLDVYYAPLDLWEPTARFIRMHRPALLVCMETEIWPNWIAKAHRSGMKIVFINGRISGRSTRSYRLIRPLIAPLLQKVDAFSMISASDAGRIIDLGAPAERVRVNGNVKMDLLNVAADSPVPSLLKSEFALGDRTPVFVAGSIRGAEVEIVMDVYDRLAALIPDLIFIVAPRHIGNAARLAAHASQRGIRWQYRTDLTGGRERRSAPVVIVNTIGELRDIYSLAAVVFCGGSLVPLGGQNILEPALWGKPVLFGPSMEDFQEARTLLEASGGARCVQDGDALFIQAGNLLRDPAQANRIGHLARQAVLANQGAAHRHAKVITDLLALTPISQEGSLRKEG